MRILTLNLRHGGNSRLGGIVEYLRVQQPDLAILTEFRHGTAGWRLQGALEAHGYVHQFAAQGEAGANSVLICSRPFASSIPLEPPSAEKNRIVACEVSGLHVCGVYFAGRQAKVPLFNFLIDRPDVLRRRTLIIGDFNTGLHFADEAGASFHCADLFARLLEDDLVDLWRRQHGRDAREFTWFSPRAGNGFRLDHALASTDIAGEFASCLYDHTTRPEISDHSALLLEEAGASHSTVQPGEFAGSLTGEEREGEAS